MTDMTHLPYLPLEIQHDILKQVLLDFSYDLEVVQDRWHACTKKLHCNIRSFWATMRTFMAVDTSTQAYMLLLMQHFGVTCHGYPYYTQQRYHGWPYSSKRWLLLVCVPFGRGRAHDSERNRRLLMKVQKLHDERCRMALLEWRDFWRMVEGQC